MHDLRPISAPGAEAGFSDLSHRPTADHGPGAGHESAHDRHSVERSVRLLYGFLCFASCEMILFVVILLSSFLPFIPLNKGVAPEAPASAYIPHLLLLIVSAAIVFIAVMHIVSRFRK